MSNRYATTNAKQRYRLRRRLYNSSLGLTAPDIRHLEAGPDEDATEAIVADAVEPLKQEIAQLTELASRQRADFDNFRKRTQKEKEQLRNNAQEDVIFNLLPVVDNFERAISSTPKTPENQPVIDGIIMIAGQLQKALEAHGLERVNSLHQPFDPNLHDALGVEETDEVPENHIVSEMLPGYKFKDKTIRPAMVKVAQATNKSNETTEESAD